MTRPKSEGGAASGTPLAQPWDERLDDPAEPLYTVAVVCDLLGLESQVLRRLGSAISHLSSRPSGNQRRYSRNDIEKLSSAAHLAGEGYSPAAIAAIHSLETQLAADGQNPDEI